VLLILFVCAERTSAKALDAGDDIDWHELLGLAKTEVINKPVYIVRPKGTTSAQRMRLIV
jgi:hypothetical protein